MLRRRRTAVSSVLFLTREGCSMCAEARPVVERAAAEAGVPVRVADVDVDPGLRAWSDHVPVVLLDGVVHSRWWVDETALRSALRRRPRRTLWKTRGTAAETAPETARERAPGTAPERTLRARRPPRV